MELGHGLFPKKHVNIFNHTIIKLAKMSQPIKYDNTVKPLFSSHPRVHKKWLLRAGRPSSSHSPKSRKKVGAF